MALQYSTSALQGEDSQFNATAALTLGKRPVHIAQEAGLDGSRKSHLTENRTPYRPARKEAPYRLRYAGHHTSCRERFRK
jgi:hypothetical protein